MPTLTKQHLFPVGQPVRGNITVPAGDTVANTATETAFATNFVIPGGLLTVGDIINLELWGVCSIAATQTLTLRIKIGSVTVLTIGAITGLSVGTNRAWNGRLALKCLAAGVSGQIDAHGAFAFATSAIAATPANAGNTAPSAINLSIDQTLTVTAQWGAVNAANSITVRQFNVG